MKTIQWISSNKDRAWQVKDYNMEEGKNSPSITVTDTKHQLVEGFGGCFNSCIEFGLL